MEVPPDGEIVLRARWWPHSVLRVVDHDSGADLQEVELVRCTHWENSNDIHPGKAAHAVVARRTPSPIVLPEAMETEIYWVRAPGYAWQRVAVAHRSGGERLVRLVPGGSLEVELRNYEPGRGVRVQLRAADALETKRPLMSIDPGAEARVLLEGVASGSFEVRAAIGPWFREAPPLAKERTRVVAGARATVTLTLAMPPETSHVPLAGTLEVPETWGKVHLWLTIQPPKGTGAAPIEVPREAMSRTEPGVWRWDAGGVVPGRHIVEIHPFATQRIVDVGAAGNGQARLRVPEPAEVHVKVFDPATGSHATDARLEWWTKRAEPGLGGHMAPARWDRKRELFRMRVPVGEVEFYISATGVSMSERRTIKPGRNEFTFRIKRNCGLHAFLMEGDATVPFDPDFTIEAKHLDGDGTFVHGESGPTERTLWFSEPGRYRVTFSRLADFDPIPDRTVTLEAGKIALLTVVLTRRR